MDLLPLAILAAAVVLFVAASSRLARLLGETGEPDITLDEDADATALGELAERKQMVMALMLSTRLDFEMEKIGEDDRDRTLGRLKSEAVAIMKRMDELGGTDADRQRAEQELDAFVESALGPDATRDWSAAARLRHGGNETAGVGA